MELTIDMFMSGGLTTRYIYSTYNVIQNTFLLSKTQS